ncbi:MAG: hypothetical protein AMS18_13070 [Gemmatimonas sp. SG8_17]|nr:MAG: hypothetical protein AMS18_13070 [Gemmatimonas sp. SG8_17]
MDNGKAYTDRFGHEWSVSAEQARGVTKSVVFTCGEFQLITAEAEAANPANITDTQLKELFCDAERVVVHEDEMWYVGYRRRASGRGGRAQGGMCTRFRSETGELRYAKAMILFRHMSEDALLDHLAAAQKATSSATS